MPLLRVTLPEINLIRLKPICFVYLIVLIAFFNTAALAQNNRLKGQIRQTELDSAIRDASIELYKLPDSTLVDGRLTDSVGRFEFSRLSPGNYYLKLQVIGYSPVTMDSIRLSRNETKDLGIISLTANSIFLSEVTVSGTRADIQNKLDKQSYRAQQFEGARGGSASDILKNLPGITINGQNELSVRGATGFQIMLNGKLILADAQTFLNQLSANSVERIEIITAPSASYDADGKAGVINIITRKGSTDGLVFSFNGQLGLPSTTNHNNSQVPARTGADATLNYRHNKWELAVAAVFLRNDLTGFREGDVFVKNPGANTITRFPSAGERSFKRYNYSGTVNLGYTPDSANSISVGFFAGRKSQRRLAALQYYNTTSVLTTGELLRESPYYNDNLQTKEAEFALANIDYTHKFSAISSIAVSVLYEKDKFYGYDRNLNLESNKPGAGLIQLVNNPYNKPLNGLRLKLDYTASIGRQKLETGYQFRQDKQDGAYGYSIIPVPPQPDYERFIGTANSTTAIHAIYSQLSGKNERLDYIGGLRYEYSQRELNIRYYNSNQPLNRLVLANLFPSGSLMYNLNKRSKLKAAYSRRIQRTSNAQLNPIAEREHSESLEQGDPNVLPEFINLAELGLIRSFRKASAFATVYFQGVNHPIQRVNSVYNDSILNRLFTNAGKSASFGLELGSNFQVSDRWAAYLGANTYYFTIKGDLTILGITTNIFNQGWVYSFNANTDYRIGKTWKLQANINYLSNRPTAQGEDSRFLSPNLTLRKSFMNDRLTLFLQWHNIDLGMKESNRQRITTAGTLFYTTTNYIYETDLLLLNFSFNLNKLSAKSKSTKTEFGEREF